LISFRCEIEDTTAASTQAGGLGPAHFQERILGEVNGRATYNSPATIAMMVQMISGGAESAAGGDAVGESVPWLFSGPWRFATSDNQCDSKGIESSWLVRRSIRKP